MKQSRFLRIFTIVLLSLTAGMTLLGAIGTTCVAFAAEKFGPSMAPLIPVKPIFQILVVLSLGAGIFGVVSIVRLGKAVRNAWLWVIGFLILGAVTSSIQFYYSLTLRGSTAPNSMRLYLTLIALIWMLILRIPGVWQRSGFDKTDNQAGPNAAAGAAAMILTGLLTLSAPLWAMPTHYIQGINQANALRWQLIGVGSALILMGGIWFLSRLNGVRRQPMPFRGLLGEGGTDQA